MSDWADDAACKGHPSLFFAPEQERPAAREARKARAVKEYCSQCPVQAECKAEAHARGEIGVWAGKDEYDRAALGIGHIRLLAGNAARVYSQARRRQQREARRAS